VLKRALEAANTVNGLIEADIIDVFQVRQMQRTAATQAAA
jgi:hypothetical protein